MGKEFDLHLLPLTGACSKGGKVIPEFLELFVSQLDFWTIAVRPIRTCKLTIYMALIHGCLDIGWKQKGNEVQFMDFTACWRKKRDTTEISSNSRPHTPKDPVTELKGPGEFKGAELCGYEL